MSRLVQNGGTPMHENDRDGKAIALFRGCGCPLSILFDRAFFGA